MKLTKTQRRFAEAIAEQGFGELKTLTREQVGEIVEASGLCWPYWITGHLGTGTRGEYYNPLRLRKHYDSCPRIKEDVKTEPVATPPVKVQPEATRPKRRGRGRGKATGRANKKDTTGARQHK